MSYPTLAEQIQSILDLFCEEGTDTYAALKMLLSYRPEPESKGWEEDLRLQGYWFSRALAVWDAIPVEFRGPPTNPHSLVEKVELMAKEIGKLREQVKKLEIKP